MVIDGETARPRVQYSKAHATEIGGRMTQPTKPPATPEEYSRWRVRGIEGFSVEELALLQQKLEGWIRDKGPPAGGKLRRSPFVMRPKTPNRT
jgi:hypothetical protein